MVDAQLPVYREYYGVVMQHPLPRSKLPTLWKPTEYQKQSPKDIWIRQLPDLRRGAITRTICSSSRRWTLSFSHFSNWWRQVARFPATGYHGRTNHAWSHRGHLAFAIVDERPGWQPCRARHYRCGDHQRTPRPHQSRRRIQSGSQRKSQPSLHCARNASIQNHRECAAVQKRGAIRYRRGTLFFLMGTGFPRRLFIHRRFYSQTSRGQKTVWAHPHFLFHSYRKAEGHLRHTRLFQKETGFGIGVVCLLFSKEEPEIWCHLCGDRGWKIQYPSQPDARKSLPHNRICFTYSEKHRACPKTYPRWNQGFAF